MTRWIATALVLTIVLAAPAAAQDTGEEEEFDVVKALKEVTRLLKETEKSLVDSIAGGDSEGAAESGEKAKKAIEKLIRKGEETGQAAVDKMNEIIEKAPRQPGQGGGQSQDQQSESESERQKRMQDQQAKERDPKNSSEGNKEPKDGKESEREEVGTAANPPPQETDDPSMPNPDDDWLGRLPDKLKQLVQNADWDKLPPKFRKLLQKYFEKMADKESESDR